MKRTNEDSEIIVPCKFSRITAVQNLEAFANLPFRQCHGDKFYSSTQADNNQNIIVTRQHLNPSIGHDSAMEMATNCEEKTTANNSSNQIHRNYDACRYPDRIRSFCRPHYDDFYRCQFYHDFFF